MSDPTPASKPASTPGADAASKPASKTVRRNALLERLQAEFAVFRDYLPLAIGIHKQLMERMPDLDKNKVRIAMHSHTASTRYLKALTEGAPRFDLDGQPAGEVTTEQQAVAAQTLRDRLKKAAERRKAEEEEAKRQVEEEKRQAKLLQLAQKFNTR